MTAREWLAGVAGAAAVLAIVAGIAESRRIRRNDLDRTGWVPWRGIQVAAVFATLLLAILAWKAG
jgi:hypothetical protein